ncbi:Threonine dehydratase [Giardia duodenalis]|uniref:Threonine dehydratase n=2 Tax=Giardia intestinalis TaxID=5741 RepID=A8BFR5_GIAIC|nr:Threonine dehydratase [Giardia intestinalis]KAE8303390.1 Threonine dehydratase [Giardia intestinalis]|eukprot:XP_001707324.1 Threonine dehydratase lateral transfer candidate [Giardia lamblia ATCC 50803]
MTITMQEFLSFLNMGEPPVYNFPLLDRDMGCKVYLKMENMSSNMDIAYRCYAYSIGKITGWDKSKSICFKVTNYKAFPLLIPLVGAAASLHYRISVQFAPGLLTNFAYAFVAYACHELGADLDNYVADIVVEKVVHISDHFREAIWLMLDATHAQMANEVDIVHQVVIPQNVMLYRRNDFATYCLEYYKKIAFSGDLTLVHLKHIPAMDPHVWVQTVRDSVTHEQFFANCIFGETHPIVKAAFDALYNEIDTVKYFKKLIENQYNELVNSVSQEELRGFPYSTALVDQDMVHLGFYKFLSTTHCISTNVHVEAFTALLLRTTGFRRFNPTPNVLCFITGAVSASLEEIDIASNIEYSLMHALIQSGELMNFVVKLNTLDGNLMTRLTDILSKHSINILSFHVKTIQHQQVSIKASGPGYQHLVSLYNELSEVFGDENILGLAIPKYNIKEEGLRDVSYEEFNEGASSSGEPIRTYVSPIKSCDEITPATIELAYNKLQAAKAIHETPCIISKAYSNILQKKTGVDHTVILQFENVQQTGSFKIRGASNMLIKSKEWAESNNTEISGVVACSAGNHAQGVSKTSDLLGIRCTIVCPETAPTVKLVNTKRYNAEVIKHGAVFDEASKYSQELCEKRGWMFIPPYNSFDVIEGQGTIAHELMNKMVGQGHVSSIDRILVNIGGGGMISGISLYAKRVNPNIKITGIQAEKVFPLRNYKESGQLVPVDKTAGTIADGCNVKVLGGIHNDVLKNYVDEFISVTENEIASAVVHALITTGTLCEGAGAMGIAALMYDKLTLAERENIAVVLCGGNIDLTRVRQIYNYGLIALGRMLSVEIRQADTYGSLAKLSKIALKYYSTIRYVTYLRGGDDLDWDQMVVKVDIKIPSPAVYGLLSQEIRASFDTVTFLGETVIPRYPVSAHAPELGSSAVENSQVRVVKK